MFERKKETNIMIDTQLTKFTRIDDKNQWMFIGFIGHDNHNTVFRCFSSHGYDYTCISEQTNIPLLFIKEHIEYILTYMHIAGYELPVQAYPIPFDIFDSDRTERITHIMDEVKNKIQRYRGKLQNIHPYFRIDHNLKNSVLYTERNTLLPFVTHSALSPKDVDIMNGIRYVLIHGVCSLKHFFTLYLDRSNYRARDLAYFKECSFYNLFAILEVASKHKFVTLRSTDQSVFNAHIRPINAPQRKMSYYDTLKDTITDLSLDSDERVMNLKQVIKEGRWNDTFLMSRLTCTLQNMNHTNKKQFRYPADIKLYGHCALNTMGEAKYRVLIGDEEDKDSVSDYDPCKQRMIWMYSY